MNSKSESARHEVREQLTTLLSHFNSKLKLDEPLRPQIDSLSLVEVVEEIEKRFGVTITYNDFSNGFLGDLDQTVEFLMTSPFVAKTKNSLRG